MEAPSPESSRLDLLQQTSSPSLKRVQPLRIVKRRSNSDCGDPEGYSVDLAARQCSHETDESRGSAPEPPGGEMPLTIPKIRGRKSSQILDGLDDVYEEPAPLGHEPYLPRGSCYTLIPMNIR